MKATRIPLPNFQVPALVERDLIYLDSRQFAGRWIALCFLPYVGLVEAAFLDHKAEAFGQVGAALLIVCSGARPLQRLWSDRTVKPRTPLLADPLGRLHRSFGVPVNRMPARCQTFLIDPAGVVRFPLIHDFTERGLSVLHEVVVLSQAQDTGGLAARTCTLDSRKLTIDTESHVVLLQRSKSRI
jgi:alkyl hydroperoxide reductase subunit AhpC